MDTLATTGLEEELSKASNAGDSSRVLELCQKGVNPDGYRNAAEYTALLVATVEGHEEIVRILVAHRANVNSRSLRDNSALILAANRNYLNICSTLVYNMADVNAQNECSTTALISASYRGHRKVVSLLLKHGADMNRRNYDGSALMNARYRRMIEIAQILLVHHGEGRAVYTLCSDRIILKAIGRMIRMRKRAYTHSSGRVAV